MNLSRKRPQVIATIALCAAVIALGVGVIAQRLSAARMFDDILAQKQLLSKSKQDLKDRAKYHSEYTDLSLKLGGRMSTCSWSDQMPYMVAQVTGIVESKGLKVARLEPEPMTSSGAIERFPMRIGFETDLKHVTDVLRELKSAQPLIDIERLDIRNAPNGNGKLQISMTVASFVVLDKDSPVVRRRAVIPVKKDKASEEKKSDTPSTTPEVTATEKPAPKPEFRQPATKPAQMPMQRPNGSEHGRNRGPESPRMEKPPSGNGGKPVEAAPPAGGKATSPPETFHTSSEVTIEGRPEGGWK